jgi:hemolysin-activating ACP:hemolysin acyltransferase
MPGAALFTGPPTPARVHDAFALGIAAQLLVDTDRDRLSIASLIAWLTTPIKLGQILFLTSWERIPLGFATWAYLTPRTLERMASGEQDLPLLEDWNEGTELWLVDVVAPCGHAAELMKHLRQQLGSTHRVAHFRRESRYRRVNFRPASVTPHKPWGSSSQSDLMFDQTGHIAWSPFDAGWLGGGEAPDPGLQGLAEQTRPR